MTSAEISEEDSVQFAVADEQEQDAEEGEDAAMDHKVKQAKNGDTAEQNTENTYFKSYFNLE